MRQTEPRQRWSVSVWLMAASVAVLRAKVLPMSSMLPPGPTSPDWSLRFCRCSIGSASLPAADAATNPSDLTDTMQGGASRPVLLPANDLVLRGHRGLQLKRGPHFADDPASVIPNLGAV